MADAQLMTPVAALSRGLQLTRIEDGRVVARGSEDVLLRRLFSIGGVGVIFQGARLMMEILEAPKVYPLPNAPRTCRGLVNLRGGLVPVFDLRRMLGGEGGGLRWVLVVERGEQAAGFVVDQLPRQVSLPSSSRLDQAPACNENFDGAVVESHRLGGDEVLFTVDHRRLLTILTGQAMENAA